MREKELRLALVCYGGISLAVYMHGVTKEIWRVLAASRARLDGAPLPPGSTAVYRDLLDRLQTSGGVQVRVITDIIAGSSAGGINGVFLARAIASGQSLEPLTDLWLDNADVERLLDDDARPLSRATKFWAVPIAWAVMKRRGNVVDRTVGASAQAEVRTKLSRFVRARWFAPPFGGERFLGMLLDALEAMEADGVAEPLVPQGHPVDLFVTVTDFSGYERRLSLNSPAEVTERDHRLTLTFRRGGPPGARLDDSVALAAAARATASFPGAFPPFAVVELDRVLAARGQHWPQRGAFVAAQLPSAATGDGPDTRPECRALIDGSVLANAPFGPAMAALRQRPARRQVDRRFVYIDPKPNQQSISLGTARDDGAPIGFFSAILGAVSEIPRKQPIGANIDALNSLSTDIRRMQYIIDAMRAEVDDQVAAILGGTFFLHRPTPTRLGRWRARAQGEAATRAGYAYAPYGHLKLSSVIEESALLAASLAGAGRAVDTNSLDYQAIRGAMWRAVRAQGLNRLTGKDGVGAQAGAIAFFRRHDIAFRIRRLRFVVRLIDRQGTDDDDAGTDGLTSGRAPESEELRGALFTALGLLTERQTDDWLAVRITSAPTDGAAWMEAIADARDLPALDTQIDALLAPHFEALPRVRRRALLLGYLGFPFYDVAMMPLVRGRGYDEFDPIRIDRISPDDATAIRSGGAAAVLKGIEFNSFGAFFSRAYRENDYLWGRLHGAERMIDIVASTITGEDALSPDELLALKRNAFRAILDEEAPRLTHIAPLVTELRGEIGGD